MGWFSFERIVTALSAGLLFVTSCLFAVTSFPAPSGADGSSQIDVLSRDENAFSDTTIVPSSMFNFGKYGPNDSFPHHNDLSLEPTTEPVTTVPQFVTKNNTTRYPFSPPLFDRPISVRSVGIFPAFGGSFLPLIAPPQPIFLGARPMPAWNAQQFLRVKSFSPPTGMRFPEQMRPMPQLMMQPMPAIVSVDRSAMGMSVRSPGKLSPGKLSPGKLFETQQKAMRGRDGRSLQGERLPMPTQSQIAIATPQYFYAPGNRYQRAGANNARSQATAANLG